MRTDYDPFHKAQLAILRTESPAREPDTLTPQTQIFVAGLVSGMSIALAGKHAGMKEQEAFRLAESDTIKQAIAHHRRNFAKKLNFGVEDAHHMYMQAYRAAGTSAEMTKATDSLVKLHRLLDPLVANPPGESTNHNARSIEHLSRDQLLRLAQIGVDTLVPQPAEAVEYDDDDGE